MAVSSQGWRVSLVRNATVSFFIGFLVVAAASGNDIAAFTAADLIIGITAGNGIVAGADSHNAI